MKKTLWRLSELKNGREYALEELPVRVLNHYVSDNEIAAFLETLEYPEVAECIRTLMPEEVNGRSGELGEILAAEFVEERLGYEVPVRKLRGKDHREMAMRGEDVIGIAYDNKDRLKLLKGEAKSARKLSRGTIQEARTRLEENHGRPSAYSLIFVARQLIQSEDPEKKVLGGKILKQATNRAIPKRRLAHLLFTLSGNKANKITQDDFHAADGTREQYLVNLRISGHGEFVEAVYDGAYEEAGSIGDN
ncbi:MAG: SAVED domain-containing protein [Nitrospinae bacterium]|nr:SAVED domain-containing protein [Nitrospinota bacterium]